MLQQLPSCLVIASVAPENVTLKCEHLLVKSFSLCNENFCFTEISIEGFDRMSTHLPPCDHDHDHINPFSVALFSQC